MKNCGFLLLFIALLAPTVLAQATKIEVKNGVVSLNGRVVQVKANSFSYEGEQTTLTGNVTITIADKNGTRVHITAEIAHVETALSEVQVGVSGISEFPGESMKSLQATLQAAPQSPKFRINWHEQFGMSGDDVTAVYNRPAKTLNFYNVGWWAGDTVVTRYFLFSGVTDSNLTGILLNLRNNNFGFHGKNSILRPSAGIALPDGVERRILPR